MTWGGGECRCRRLDLTQNHHKLEKKTKKKKNVEKKIVFGSELIHGPQITDPALYPLG